MHICYEMTREMDYMECRQLSVYEDIVTRSLVELDAEEQRKGGSGRKQNQRESTGSSPSADVVGVILFICSLKQVHNKRLK